MDSQDDSWREESIIEHYCNGEHIDNKRKPMVISYVGKKGERYVLPGKEIRSNRERDGVSLVADGRPHELGRAPLYIGAPALIFASGRPKRVFILFDYLSLGNRASVGFRELSTNADDCPCRGCRDNSWQNRASVR